MESEALRKSNALLQEISRTIHTESIEEEYQSNDKPRTDDLSRQLILLTDNCAAILERSRRLAEAIQQTNCSNIQQINRLCSRYITELHSQQQTQQTGNL